MSFKISHRDECEKTGSWQLVRRTLGRLDPSHRRTVRNGGSGPASVLIVSAPQTSGYEPMGWA